MICELIWEKRYIWKKPSNISTFSVFSKRFQILVQRIYAVFEMLTTNLTNLTCFQLDFLVELEKIKCFKKCRLGRKNRRRYSRYFDILSRIIFWYFGYIFIFLPSSKLKSTLKYFNSKMINLHPETVWKISA